MKNLKKQILIILKIKSKNLRQNQKFVLLRKEYKILKNNKKNDLIKNCIELI